MLDFGLYAFYAAFAIAVLGTILFEILNLVKNPKLLVRTLVLIGILLTLFGVSYALSDSKLSQSAAAMVTPTAGKLISAGLIMFYITLFLAAGAVLYSEITKSFK
jgi:hypothetical protein